MPVTRWWLYIDYMTACIYLNRPLTSWMCIPGLARTHSQHVYFKLTSELSYTTCHLAVTCCLVVSLAALAKPSHLWVLSWQEKNGLQGWASSASPQHVLRDLPDEVLGGSLNFLHGGLDQDISGVVAPCKESDGWPLFQYHQDLPQGLNN